MLAILGILSLGAGYVLIGLPSYDSGTDNDSDQIETDAHQYPMMEIPLAETANQSSQSASNVFDVSSQNEVIDGGSGTDVIIGTPFEDNLHAYGGNDYVQSSGGADTIHGGEGADTIFSGAGSDTVYGGNEDDSVLGGRGEDSLYGGLGQDTLHGQDGSDWIEGGDDTDADLLLGGSGDDTIVARENDRVIAGDGNDTIRVHLDANALVSDFDTEQDRLVVTQADGLTPDDFDFLETEAGLEIQNNGRPVITLAGLTATAKVSILIE